MILGNVCKAYKVLKVTRRWGGLLVGMTHHFIWRCMRERWELRFRN